jgi:succinyl-CoA synthetase beta subunit
MARLYEFQGKKLLEECGILIPEGGVAQTPDQARRIAEQIGKPVVLKAQVWVTGRAAIGGIKFADTPDDAEAETRNLFGLKVKNFTVDYILVEEKLSIKNEFFAGIVINDAAKAPAVIFSSAGGSGIEEIAKAHPQNVSQALIDIQTGLRNFEARRIIRKTGIKGALQAKLAGLLVKLYKTAQKYDARSAEINPLVLTDEGRVYAADCHMTIDDYAVYRHPELGIEIAREFDRPPTELEKIAYKVEESDHRGTFYFLQMKEDISPEESYIGFNGAGGGGSMMSMDAVLKIGFKLANYCDTSGNPSASKVYRAAMIILSQPNIKGYFASGSGVASQEQYHSARGLVKAFLEEDLSIPAVIRLGGNFEEKAIEILHTYLKNIPGKVEGYGRDDSPEFCAARLEQVISENQSRPHKIKLIEEPPSPKDCYEFETVTGKITIDHARCMDCKTKGCIQACTPKVLKLESGTPVLAITAEEAKRGKCTECLACEIYCRFHAENAISIVLPIPGLKEYRKKLVEEEN